MVGREPERDALLDLLETFRRPPGVEVQVYRRRRDDRKRWKYLGFIELDDVDLAYLESVAPDYLSGIAPLEETKATWGGGQYQFRFRWRDERGQKRVVRSRDIAIGGPPWDP